MKGGRQRRGLFAEAEVMYGSAGAKRVVFAQMLCSKFCKLWKNVFYLISFFFFFWPLPSVDTSSFLLISLLPIFSVFVHHSRTSTDRQTQFYGLPSTAITHSFSK